MQKHCKKENLRMLLAALFLGVAILITSAAFARDRNKEYIDCNKEAAVSAVHTAAVGLGEILKDVRRESWRVDIIRSFIAPIRFYKDKSGYFYVYNYKCLNIAHATQKNLEGQNLYNYRDTKGKFVIRELSAMAKKRGGFVEYYWVKPGHK
ncbi:MAG: cache domain-containing protein, partial [Syntrophaceae bacterium]|nr:cache domain-containing protein [Syntrophaceae bacterium]